MSISFQLFNLAASLLIGLCEILLREFWKFCGDYFISFLWSGPATYFLSNVHVRAWMLPFHIGVELLYKADSQGLITREMTSMWHVCEPDIFADTPLWAPSRYYLNSSLFLSVRSRDSECYFVLKRELKSSFQNSWKSGLFVFHLCSN